jgi:hypothetical protein
MKHLSFLLVALVFVGAGCTSSAEPSAMEQDTAPVAQDTPSSSIPADWKKETSLTGITFAYPQDMKFTLGGSTPTGSYSQVDKGYQMIVGIKNHALKMCSTGISSCAPNDLSPATPDEVYAQILKEYSEGENYVAQGEVTLGNTTAQSFLFSYEKGGVQQTLLLFKGKEGVYTLNRYLNNPQNDTVFSEILSTFSVEL